MTPTAALTPLQERKKQIREQAHANRKAQLNKDELSQLICQKFSALPEFAAARSVMAFSSVILRCCSASFAVAGTDGAASVEAAWKV